MKFAMIVLVMGLMAGCSSGSLKRCNAPVVDPSIYKCSEVVSGPYRICHQPEDLFTCQKPE